MDHYFFSGTKYAEARDKLVFNNVFSIGNLHIVRDIKNILFNIYVSDHADIVNTYILL